MVLLIFCSREELISMSELDYEMAEMPSPEIIDLTNECEKDTVCLEKKEPKIKVTVGVNSFNEIDSDLEEGEIKEPDDENVRSVLCRHFQKGKCWLGESCNYLHIGVNPYKMFVKSTALPVPIYQTVTEHPDDNPPDAWDKGLREAKKLVLHAKLKKEADIDFDEKQLYQGLDEIISENADFYRRAMNLADGNKKRWVAPDDCSPPKVSKDKVIKTNEDFNRKNVDLTDRSKKLKKAPDECLPLRKPETRRKPLKTISKENTSLKPEKVKSRTRNRSNSWSPVSSHRRRSYSSNSSSSSSSCSGCKASLKSLKSKNDIRKTKSKLERVFSRTIDSPERSRSRKQTSSHTYSPNRRENTLSTNSFIKSFVYGSYSKSPPLLRNEYTKKHPEKNVSRKPLHKYPSPPSVRVKLQPPIYSKKERSPSPIYKSRSNANRFSCSSSNMTVSCIKCTSASSSSSDEKSSAKSSPVLVSKRKSNDRKPVRERETRGIKKWLDTSPVKSRKVKEPETKKIANKEKKQISKTIEKALVKPNKTLSICSNSTDEKLSASELELLRYIPNNNRKKIGQEKKKNDNSVKESMLSPKTTHNQLSLKKDNGMDKENPSIETNPKYPPPKIVYDYGSDSVSSPHKLVPYCGSDRQSSPPKSTGSNRESPTPKSVGSNRGSPAPQSVGSNRESPTPQSVGLNRQSSPLKRVGSNTESPTQKSVELNRQSSPPKIVESNRESPTAKSVELNRQSSPPKGVGSNGENPTKKSVGLNRPSSPPMSVGSNKDSSSPKSFVNDYLSLKDALDHAPKREKNVSKESNKAKSRKNSCSKTLDDRAQIKCPSPKKVIKAESKQFDNNKMNKNNNYNPAANKPRKRRASLSSTEELSESGLELLKYISGVPRDVSKKVQKYVQKNSSVLAAKKAKQRKMSKSLSRRKSTDRNKSSELSRRELLMQQLEAVELAIAKKKRQAKLEYAKLRKRRKH